MITYGFITPDGKEIKIGCSTHARYAGKYIEDLEKNKGPEEEWRKLRIFSWNLTGDPVDFVVRGLGWIKVGQYIIRFVKLGR